MATKRQTENPPCTIHPELWKVWLANKQMGDVEKIMELAKAAGLPNSKPVITKSILYGFCNFPDLRDLITKYFADRYAHEKAQADMLTALTKKNAPELLDQLTEKLNKQKENSEAASKKKAPVKKSPSKKTAVATKSVKKTAKKK